MKPRHRDLSRRKRTVLASVLAALLLLVGLGAAYGGTTPVPAVRTAAATGPVTEDSVGPSVATAGSQVTATLVVHAASALKVDAIGVAVYDSSGNNLGFSGNTAPVVPATGYTYTSLPKSFAVGTYRILGAYRVGTVWTELPGGVLTVVAAPMPTPTPTGPAAGPSGIAGSWSLKFDDEFSGTSLDLSEWQPGWLSDAAVTGPVNSAEDQPYTRGNATVSGGSLHLALTSSYGALVNTNGHFNPVYGVFETRALLPGSGGAVYNWPAIWQDGQNWPTDGENDVMEGLSGGTSCHFHDPSGEPDGGCPDVGSGWHTFASDWEPGSVTYYYDGTRVGQITSGVTSAPMYLILNNTSGSYGGTRTAPADMQVDWVRYWQH